jgi:hypothetical protein
MKNCFYGHVTFWKKMFFCISLHREKLQTSKFLKTYYSKMKTKSSNAVKRGWHAGQEKNPARKTYFNLYYDTMALTMSVQVGLGLVKKSRHPSLVMGGYVCVHGCVRFTPS